MKRKLEISELIFMVVSYVLLTVFALCCLYPFVYAISAAISGRAAVDYSQVVLFPKDIQFDAFKRMFSDNMFWNAYSNTLFLTFFGTIWCLFYSILGAYALSKKRLLFRKFFNFFLVFTMWFAAGIVPQYLNYLDTKAVFNGVGITKTIHTATNEEGMDEAIRQAKEEDWEGICFVNLVEFDSEFGHRRNAPGYAHCLEALDKRVGEFIKAMREDDVLMITADHGNDPTFHGTDHTREKVPLLIYSPSFENGRNLDERASFADIGATILANFGLEKKPEMLGESIQEIFE